jgi:hypothetical protein
VRFGARRCPRKLDIHGRVLAILFCLRSLPEPTDCLKVSLSNTDPVSTQLIHLDFYNEVFQRVSDFWRCKTGCKGLLPLRLIWSCFQPSLVQLESPHGADSLPVVCFRSQKPSLQCDFAFWSLVLQDRDSTAVLEIRGLQHYVQLS